VARGARLEFDRWLGNVSHKNVRRNGNSSRRDFGELVRLLVVSARYVVEFYAVELVFEGPHGLAVRLCFVVVTARALHDLVDYELRVSPDVEALDARLNGDFEATKEGFVLGHVA
jgi:hypothetical protein